MQNKKILSILVLLTLSFSHVSCSQKSLKERQAEMNKIVHEDPDIHEDPRAALMPAKASSEVKEESEKQIKAFKKAKYLVMEKCIVRKSPNDIGKIIGKISKGKKIWASNENELWAKIKTKRGYTYLKKTCLKLPE